MNWTLNILIGLPIGILIFLVLLIFGIVHLRTLDRYEDPAPGIKALACALVAAIVTAVAFIPYDAQYHQWRPVSGTVEQVDSRMIAQGKGMSERFVVKVDGVLYGVDDTRAATLRPGDHVKLLCIRDWDWPSTDNGWVCKWDGQ